MKVAITGAGGYLGGHLCRFLASRDMEAVPLGRAQGFTLGSKPRIPPGTGALIHAAYDFQAFGPAANKRTNVQGSLELFSEARRSGVHRIVFISSMAAFPGCRSIYGLGKLAVEDAAKEFGAVSIRPGTIYGGADKGIFGVLKKLSSLPIVPLPGGGGQQIHLVHIDDLCGAICRLALEDPTPPTEPISLAHPEKLSIRQIINMLAGFSRHSVSIPTPLIISILFTINFFMRGNSPVRLDSLISIINPNPSVKFHKTCQTFLKFDFSA